MVNVSNAFAAMFSFFIALVLLYIFNPIIAYLLNLFDDLLMKAILTGAWLLFVVLMAYYVPIMTLTSEDNPNIFK